ncbi:MAG: hypothetical protein IIV04_02335, partial [Bacteroidaceae bacterium]|nr:hypothetical protein [Bacteroidaceae bacterium]
YFSVCYGIFHNKTHRAHLQSLGGGGLLIYRIDCSFNFFEIASAHCASQRCPLDKLLMLAAKTQTSLAFARLNVTFRPWRGITFAMKNH